MESDFGIGLNLKKINIFFKSQMDKKLAEIGLTSSQMEILIYLITNQGKEIYQKDLEKAFNLSNPTITGVLNRLEAKEFIIRNVSTQDARYKLISITEKTTDLKKEMMKHRENMIKQVTENIPQEELESLMEVLEKIMKNISYMEENNKC